MGCWGDTALKSDVGYDILWSIRDHLPDDGIVDLEQLIEVVKLDKWNSPPVVTAGRAHTGPMALAEIMMKFLDQETASLDFDGEWEAEENRFSDITSFTASKESIQWLKNYLSDTLQYAQKAFDVRPDFEDNWENEMNLIDIMVNRVKYGNNWGDDDDRLDWQNHMSALIERLDTLLDSPNDQIELVQPEEQEAGVGFRHGM